MNAKELWQFRRPDPYRPGYLSWDAEDHDEAAFISTVPAALRAVGFDVIEPEDDTRCFVITWPWP